MEDKEFLQKLIKHTNAIRQRNYFLSSELNRYKKILYKTKKLNRKKKRIIVNAIKIALENEDFIEKYNDEARKLVRWIK